MFQVVVFFCCREAVHELNFNISGCVELYTWNASKFGPDKAGEIGNNVENI